MYFYSSYLAGYFRLLTINQRVAAPDETAEELGDFCVYCGCGLAEHDQWCRGCGGEKSTVSRLNLDVKPGGEDSSRGAAAADNEAEEPDAVPAILEACEGGDVAAVRALLPGGANLTNRLGETALMWAVRERHRELIDLLLKGGADPNIRTRNPPKGIRLREGIYAEKERAPGQTALIWAIATEDEAIVRLLLERGADPNLADDWGQSPLLWAARVGNVDTAPLLIAAGAALDSACDVGRTPALSAAQQGNAELLRFLLGAGADARRTMLKDFGGQSLLHLAALSGDEETLVAAAKRNPLDIIDSQLVTPLTAAIAEKKFGSVRKLIDLGADVDARGGHSAATPLWAACWIREAEDALEMVEPLLAAGADPDLPGLFREPPLQRAVDRGYSGVVHRLLDAGADLLATDQFGTTLLMAAARSGRIALAEFLLEQGLNVNAEEDDGKTALMHAHKAEMVRLLVAAGADVNAQTNMGVTALMFREDHHLDAVQALLKLGADPGLRESTGKTAREIALCRNRHKLAELLSTWE